MGAVDSDPVWIGRVDFCANSIRSLLNIVVDDGHNGLLLLLFDDDEEE